eukprot:COSAG02_NODE_184_length_30545_cov_128.634402_8_plen_420_part_00
MDVVFGIMGSMVCDRIGVRKTAIIGLSIGLPGRFIWSFSTSHDLLKLACFFFSPCGEALIATGVYKVALKRMTTPRVRPFAYAIQYSVFNGAAGLADVAIDLFRERDDIELWGIHMTGSRQFVVSTFFVMILCLVVVVIGLHDETCTDVTDPEQEEDHLPDDAPAEPHDLQQQKPGEEPSSAPDAEHEGIVLEKQMATMPFGQFLAKLPEYHRKTTARYVFKPTVLNKDNIFSNFNEVIRMRKLWMVIMASACTFFVGLQWGFSETLMPQFLTREYGEGEEGARYVYRIHSINLWGCVIGPPLVAALSGHLEAFGVLMPGLWVMAAAPIFVILFPNVFGFVMWEIIFTAGECMWSPRLIAWLITLAPTGREGLFIAISQGKDLILDPLKSILGGNINEWFMPKCEECWDKYGHFCSELK